MESPLLRITAFAVALTTAGCTGAGSALHSSTLPAVGSDGIVSSTTAKITLHKIPLSQAQPNTIALGGNGNLYALQAVPAPGGSYLWQIAESGKITRGPSVGPVVGAGITHGAYGAVYFGLDAYGWNLAKYSNGRLTIQNQRLHINAIYFLTQAKDGSVWFSDPGDDSAGHIAKAGSKTLGLAAGDEELLALRHRHGPRRERVDGGTVRNGHRAHRPHRRYRILERIRAADSQRAGLRHSGRPRWKPLVCTTTANHIGRISTSGKITEFSITAFGGRTISHHCRQRRCVMVHVEFWRNRSHHDERIGLKLSHLWEPDADRHFTGLWAHDLVYATASWPSR